MKKIIAIITIFLFANAIQVFADDVNNSKIIKSTDILVYMDDMPIQGYDIEDDIYICLEDLTDYGFSVHYNDEARTLFVNKIDTVNNKNMPEIKRGNADTIVGYTAVTDIKALLNGSEVNTENIGGRLAVSIDCLDDLEDDYLSGIADLKNYPKYFMMQTYNHKKRIINIYSDISILGMYERNINIFNKNIEDGALAYEIVDYYTNDMYDQYLYKGVGRDVNSSANGISAVRFYKSGRIVDYTEVFYKYLFVRRSYEGTSLYDDKLKPIFKTDGKELFFNAERSVYKGSLMGMRDTFESGDYLLDMDTCELKKVNTIFHKTES